MAGERDIRDIGLVFEDFEGTGDITDLVWTNDTSIDFALVTSSTDTILTFHEATSTLTFEGALQAPAIIMPGCKAGDVLMSDAAGKLTCTQLEPQKGGGTMYIVKGLTGVDWVLIFLVAVIAAKVAHRIGWKTIVRPAKKLFRIGQTEARGIKREWDEA